MEGYSQPELTWSPPYSLLQGIEKVYKLYKTTGNYPNEIVRKIDVIESSTTLAVHPLTFYHTTVVMNYLFADGVVVMYPELTFKRLAVISGKPNTRHSPYSKYKARGYTLCESGSDSVLCRTPCLQLYRTTLDAASMTTISKQWQFRTVPWLLDFERRPLQCGQDHLQLSSFAPKGCSFRSKFETGPTVVSRLSPEERYP